MNQDSREVQYRLEWTKLRYSFVAGDNTDFLCEIIGEILRDMGGRESRLLARAAFLGKPDFSTPIRAAIKSQRRRGG